MPPPLPTRTRTAPPPVPGTAFHRYLRIEDLHSLRHVEFAPRGVVRGLYTGRHDSPQHGHSVEFNDYREYVPGDEIGNIDWKVYGRTDRLFLKLFEHQTDMVVYLLVDASASMDYRGMFAEPPAVPSARRSRRRRRRPLPRSSVSKYDQACMMAAAIAFLVIKQQDRVSFGFARHGLDGYLPAHGTFPHLLHILDAMEQDPPSTEANLASALEEMARRGRRKGMLILISDLMEDEGPILRQFGHFLQRGNDIILFHMLHADELAFPDLGEAMLTDSETRDIVRLNADEIRGDYQDGLDRYLRRWQGACRRRGIDYNLVSTSQTYYQALRHYLFQRAAMR